MVTVNEYGRALLAYKRLHNGKLARTLSTEQWTSYTQARLTMAQYMIENPNIVEAECMKYHRAEIDALRAEVDALPDKKD